MRVFLKNETVAEWYFAEISISTSIDPSKRAYWEGELSGVLDNL